MPAPLSETHDNAITTWIPLTENFQSSSGCRSVFRLNGASLVAFDPGYGLDVNTEVKCVPSAVTTSRQQARSGLGHAQQVHRAISTRPMVCPVAWTTVATYVARESSTQVMCCPSGYSVANATPGPVNGDCVSDVSQGAIITYASTDATAPQGWHLATTTLASASIVGAVAVVGYNVESAAGGPVATAKSTRTSIPSFSESEWKNLLPSTTELVPLPEATTTTTITTTCCSSTFSSRATLTSSSTLYSTSSPSTSTNPNLEALKTPSPTPNSQDTTLSPALKASIFIGVSLSILGLMSLFLALLIIRRRKRNNCNRFTKPHHLNTSPTSPAGSLTYSSRFPNHQQQQQPPLSATTPTTIHDFKSPLLHGPPPNDASSPTSFAGYVVPTGWRPVYEVCRYHHGGYGQGQGQGQGHGPVVQLQPQELPWQQPKSPVEIGRPRT